jgi:DNA-binding response OmpR family regulator
MDRFDTESGRTALVVDYDSWERSFATTILNDQGYRVVAASNGASGLRLAQQQPCDVILLDLVLPELPGVEFVRQLRATEVTREIPVIVLGSTSDGLECSTQGCVPKPLEGIRVLREVGRVLDGPRETSSNRAGRPLVLVASQDSAVADGLADYVRRSGSVACVARSEGGCLRVATAVGPDVVLLDSSLPSRLEGLLRAHPASGSASIVRVPEHLTNLWAH